MYFPWQSAYAKVQSRRRKRTLSLANLFSVHNVIFQSSILHVRIDHVKPLLVQGQPHDAHHVVTIMAMQA